MSRTATVTARPQATAPAATCTHLITLINRATGEEFLLTTHTATNSFSDVQREVTHQRIARGMQRYEIFEWLEVTPSF